MQFLTGGSGGSNKNIRDADSGRSSCDFLQEGLASQKGEEWCEEGRIRFGIGEGVCERCSVENVRVLMISMGEGKKMIMDLCGQVIIAAERGC